jgi:type VII secretion integral membrane protein EccD
VATIVAAAALVGLITAAPPHVVGSVSALTSLGLLALAARISIAIARLSPQLPSPPDLAAKAIRARTWLTSLLAAFACGAALGAIVTVLAAPHGPPRIVFGALTGVLLLLRVRRGDGRDTPVFAACGTTAIATTFVASGSCGAWTAVTTAALAAAATCLGFVASAASPSPVLRRTVDALEGLALVALVPITCWVCGLYGAVRGLSLP